MNDATKAGGDWFLVAPLIIVVLLIALTIIPQELLSIWINRDGQFDLDLRLFDYAGLALSIGVAIALARRTLANLRRSRIKSAISYLVPAILLFLGLAFMNSIIGVVQYPKLYLFRKEYDSCKRLAERYYEEESFKICSARIHGNAYQIVAYDSGGQIEMKTDRQSESFKTFLRLRVSPVLSSCDFHASRVSDSFYYVQADCG